jgi:hypothetical protein
MPTGTRPTGGGASGGASSTSSTLTALLNKTTTRWSAAVVGDQAAAGYILSSNTAVMAIGGWSGSDASPTLAQFQQYVKEGKITYFIVSSQQGGGARSGDSSSVGSRITTWVKAHYTAKTVGESTVYLLTS